MDLAAVKRVESPVKYKQLKPVMNSNSDNHIQYEIQFPAGSMGLELEPVIISSERKIGCRVKDFYFGVDYTGTEEDRSMLQGTISIGDILMKINGVSVVSLPFTSVLDMLRSLTSTERVVVFKNLTKSWEVAYNQTASTSKQQAAIEYQTEGTRKLSNESARYIDVENISHLSNIELNLNKTKNSDRNVSKETWIKHSDTAAAIQLRDQLSRSNGCTPDQMRARKMGVLSPIKMGVLSPVKINYHENQRTKTEYIKPSQIKHADALNISALSNCSSNSSSTVASSFRSPPKNRSLQKLLGYPVRDLTTSDRVNNDDDAHEYEDVDVKTNPPSVLTPSSSMKQQDRRISSPKPVVNLPSDHLRPRTKITPSWKSNQAAAEVTVPNTGPTDGPGLSHIIEIVTDSIGSRLAGVGSVVGERAEKALHITSELLPIYSTNDMNEVIAQKNDLLKELSHYCMLLGQAEDRVKSNEELEMVNQTLQEKIWVLESSIQSTTFEKEDLNFKCKTYQAEMHVLREERKHDAMEKDALKNDLQDLRAFCQDLSDGEKFEVNQLKIKLEEDSTAWKLKEVQWQENFTLQQQRYEQNELELKMIEKDRDALCAELEVLREISTSDKLSAIAECSRLRANITSQQELHKGCLIQYDKELYELRKEVICCKESVDRIQLENQQIDAVKVKLQEELSSTKLRLHSFSGQLCDAERALKDMETENNRLTSQLRDLDEKEKSQRAAVMISESESGMLKDKATLAVLTSEALESEIKMLRRDIQERDDSVKERDITIMNLTSQLNALQDTLLRAKQDLDDNTNSNMAVSLRNESTISELKREMEALQNQHSDELAVIYTELNSTQRDHGQLQRQMADVKAQYDLVQRLCLEKDAVIEQHSCSLISANEQMSSALAQIKSLHDSINALEQQSSDMELLIQQKDSELQSVEITLKQVRADMSRVVIDCNEQLVQKELDAVNQVAALQDKYDAQEKEFLTALRLAEDTQDKLRSDLQTKLSEMTEKYDQQMRITQELSDQTQEQSNHHQRMLQSKEEELSRMNHDVQLKQSDINSRNIQIAQLESKIVEMNHKASSLTSEVQSMKSSSMELLEKLRSRELETDSLKNNMLSLEASYLEREKNQIEEVSDLRNQLRIVSCRLQASQNKCNAVEGRHINAMSALQLTHLELRQLKSSLKDMKSDMFSLVAVHKSIVRSLQDQCDDSLQELSKKPLTSSTVGSPMAALESRLNQIMLEKESLHGKVSQAELTIASMESNYVELFSKVRASEHSSTELSLALQTQRDANLVLESSVTELQSEVISLRNKNADLIEKMRSEERRMRGEVTDRLDQEKLFRSTLAEHVTSLESSRLKCRDLETKLEAIEKNRTADETDLRIDYQAAKSQLERVTSAHKADLERFEQECKNSRSHLLKVEEEFAKSQVEWMEKCKELTQQLDSTLEQSRVEREDLICSYEEQLQKLISKHGSDIESKAQEHDAALRIKDDKMSEMEQSTTKQFKELKSRVQIEFDALISRHKLELNSIRDKHSEEVGVVRDQHKSELDALTSQHQDEIQKLQKEMKRLVATREQQLKALSEKSASDFASLSSTQTDLQLLRQCVLEKDQQMERMKLDSMELRNRIDTYMETFAANQSTLITLSSEIAKLKVENSAITAKFDELLLDKVSQADIILTRNQKIEMLECELSRMTIKTHQITAELSASCDRLEASKKQESDLQDKYKSLEIAKNLLDAQSETARTQFGQLRVVLVSQQQALALAESREAEYHSNRVKLELMLKESEAKFRNLHLKYTEGVEKIAFTHKDESDASTVAELQLKVQEMAHLANNAQKSLQRKSAELEWLHQHVTDLLASTITPKKKTNPASKTVLTESVLDKENTLVACTTTQSASSNADINSFYVVDEKAHEVSEWHNEILNHSLQLYEILMSSFGKVKELYRLDGGLLDGNMMRETVRCICVALSVKHNKLHHLLNRIPWTANSEVPTLIAAHEYHDFVPSLGDDVNYADKNHHHHHHHPCDSLESNSVIAHPINNREVLHAINYTVHRDDSKGASIGTSSHATRLAPPDSIVCTSLEDLLNSLAHVKSTSTNQLTRSGHDSEATVHTTLPAAYFGSSGTTAADHRSASYVYTESISHGSDRFAAYHNSCEESFDSVCSDVFNISAESGADSSSEDDEDSLFRYFENE